MDFIKEWGKIAGIAGISLGVFVVLFREVIRKNIFPTLDENSAFIIILLFMVFIWSLSIFSISQYYRYRQGSTQLTVYVHGAKGKQDIVLENTGKLVIDFDNDRRVAMIGQNGRTNFGEIPEKFIGKEIGIGLEAPGYTLINPKKQYPLNGNPIYISVKRDGGLGRISGIVKNRDGSIFIKDALVMIGNETTTKTDKLGIFKIKLPEKMQVKDDKTPYLLTVKKEGYAIKSEQYYPKSGDIEIRLDPA